MHRRHFSFAVTVLDQSRSSKVFQLACRALCMLPQRSSSSRIASFDPSEALEPLAHWILTLQTHSWYQCHALRPLFREVTAAMIYVR